MKMDERTRAELHKINQERFFISAIVVAISLIIKISFTVSPLAMLGEFVAGGVLLIYLIPYFTMRYKYRVLDEMIIGKLKKLSTAFFVAQLASLIPVVIIDTVRTINRIGSNLNPMDSCMPFIIVLTMVENIYGMIRMNSEKFVSNKAACTPLPQYKSTLLRRTIIVNICAAVVLATLIVLSVVLDKDGELTNPIWIATFSCGTMAAILTVPAAWMYYAYSLSMRNKLEKRIIKEEQDNHTAAEPTEPTEPTAAEPTEPTAAEPTEPTAAAEPTAATEPTTEPATEPTTAAAEPTQLKQGE